MDIQALMEWLRRETMSNIDLRYNGSWSVMIARGNLMRCVHGTVTDNPIRSLEIAKAKWESRSEDNPF